MLSMKYHTKNYVRLTNYLKAHINQKYTVNELSEALNNDVPIASLYRILKELEENQLVFKCEVGEDKAAYYQYFDRTICHHHLHLMCIKCGRIIHLNEQENNDIQSLINSKYCFNISLDKNVLHGICKECSVL